MAELPTKEGTVPFNISSIDHPCFTHYKIFGDLSKNSPPVIVVHGGPGAGHEYLLPFANIWPRYGLPVVFYDQIGCAASTHLPQTLGDTSLWQVSLFIAELNNLIDSLHLRSGPGFHLLGQSWGGMIAAEFAGSRPKGLRRLVLASAIASWELYTQGIQLLRQQLPLETQNRLTEAEQKSEFDSPMYKEAVGVFFQKHVCRVELPLPHELSPALQHLSEDTSVYGTMYVTLMHLSFPISLWLSLFSKLSLGAQPEMNEGVSLLYCHLLLSLFC